MKSSRDCRTARFELSDSCPELLGVISGAGKVLKEISFGNFVAYNSSQIC